MGKSLHYEFAPLRGVNGYFTHLPNDAIAHGLRSGESEFAAVQGRGNAS